jgi:hypothetical protein
MRGVEPLTVIGALSIIVEVAKYILAEIKDAVDFLVKNAIGLIIILITLTTVKDVGFSGANLLSAISKNTIGILTGLINPIDRSMIKDIPFINMFVDNIVLLQFLTLVNVIKLYIFIDIVFFKFGSLVIQWYSFCWSFVGPLILPKGITLPSYLKKLPHTKEEI